MATGTVQAIKRGKSVVVTISGQDYFPGKTDINGMNLGDAIEFDTSSWTYRGKEYWGINEGWKKINAPATRPGTGPYIPDPMAPHVGIKTTPESSAYQAPIAAPSAPEVPQLTQNEQIFCQAVLKSAIEAGLIKTPLEMTDWVIAVRNLCRYQA